MRDIFSKKSEYPLNFLGNSKNSADFFLLENTKQLDFDTFWHPWYLGDKEKENKVIEKVIDQLPSHKKLSFLIPETFHRIVKFVWYYEEWANKVSNLKVDLGLKAERISARHGLRKRENYLIDFENLDDRQTICDLKKMIVRRNRAIPRGELEIYLPSRPALRLIEVFRRCLDYWASSLTLFSPSLKGPGKKCCPLILFPH